MNQNKSETSEFSVGVLGLGNWGTALANHLATKGVKVLGWSHDKEIVDAINSTHRNPKYVKHAKLHERLHATAQFNELRQCEFLVVAVPSAALPEVVPKIEVDESTIIVSAVKGVAGESLLTPLQYLAKHGPRCAGTAVLSGPSFAKDIVLHLPSGVVAASSVEKVARKIADLFSCEWMKVYTSDDPLGVELGGIVKNVIALAVGVCDGLSLGDSARAGLVTRGLAEMMRLAQAMGANIRTLSGLSGLGDLVMTATCDASRNRTVGLRLGKGEKLSAILESLGSVAEGVDTTPLVLQLAKRYSVEMPITMHVAKLLSGEVSAGELVKALLTRPLRRELD